MPNSPDIEKRKLQHHRAVARFIMEQLLDRGPLTRQDILAQVAVRPASFLQIVRQLLDAGLIEEPDRKSKRTGRRSPTLRVRPQAGCFVGLEFDVGRAWGVCLDAGGQVLATADGGHVPIADKAAAHRALQGLIADLRQQPAARDNEWKGIALADPGLADATAGISLRAVNIKGWENLPTADWLKQATGGLPAGVWASPSVHAYAEYVLANPPCPGSLFHLELDAGVGGGFVKNGRIFDGDTCCTMEIGHVIVKENGPTCQCGNSGCLEALVGLTALRRRLAQLQADGVDTRLSDPSFSPAHLAACVRDGDKAARKLADEIAEHVGRALACMVTLLNPSTIVFSGALAGLGPVLTEGVRRVIGLRCLSAAVEQLDLRVSTLPDYAAAVGAALAMRRQVLVEAASETA
jgi:predicted NBD/HSP70 family sugar kinase